MWSVAQDRLASCQSAVWNTLEVLIVVMRRMLRLMSYDVHAYAWLLHFLSYLFAVSFVLRGHVVDTTSTSTTAAVVAHTPPPVSLLCLCAVQSAEAESWTI